MNVAIVVIVFVIIFFLQQLAALVDTTQLLHLLFQNARTLTYKHTYICADVAWLHVKRFCACNLLLGFKVRQSTMWQGFFQSNIHFLRNFLNFFFNEIFCNALKCSKYCTICYTYVRMYVHTQIYYIWYPITLWQMVQRLMASCSWRHFLVTLQ